MHQRGRKLETNKRTTLRQLVLFKEVPVELLYQFEATAQILTVERGDVLKHQAEPSDCYFVVQAGCCRLVQHSTQGRDVTLETFVADDVIGLVIALQGRKYPGTIESLKTGVVIRLSTATMLEVVDSYPLFYRNIMNMMRLRLLDAHERIRELSTEPVEQRIARSLVRLVRKLGDVWGDGRLSFDVALSRQDLAQFSGTTLETVSRVLKSWERENIVETGRERIIVLDLSKMRAIARGY